MSSFTMSPIDRVYRTYAGTFTDSTGATVTPASVDVVAVPKRTQLTTGLTWTPATLTAGKLRVLYAGPAADPTGAIPIPAAGADVYIRVTDTPEIQAVKVDTIVIGD